MPAAHPWSNKYLLGTSMRMYMTAHCSMRGEMTDEYRRDYTARRPSTGFKRWAINLRFHSLVHGDSVAKFALWNTRMIVL